MIIESGTGNGRLVGVTAENQLNVRAETHSIQHHKSAVDGQAYQVIGDFAAVNNATHTILHCTNDNTTKDMVITYIRMQYLDQAGGTTIPAAATYFQIGTGTAYSSGGSAVTPVNMNTGSGQVSSITSYDNNATVTGTFTEIDRWYPVSDGDTMTYNKQASLIIKPGDTVEVRVVSDNTSGVAYSRISYIMTNPGE